MTTGALPDRVLNWATSFVPGEVVDVKPIGGGITQTKWVVRLKGADPLVIRWTDPKVWGAIGREHVRREALACQLLDDSVLPVPRLIASDLDGALAGGPTLLMTWRPGAVRLDQLQPAAITAWAQLLLGVHQQDVPAKHRPPTFAYRGPTRPEVPTWARWPSLWQMAIDLWTGTLLSPRGAPPTPFVLLHRDFHLGNTLWRGETVSGLVDWAETSWGPPDLDVAHACSDFAMLHTIADSEAFRAAYVQHGGRLDPDADAARFWLVSDILGFLPDPAHILPAMAGSRPDLSADDVRHGLEDLLASTLN